MRAPNICEHYSQAELWDDNSLTKIKHYVVFVLFDNDYLFNVMTTTYQHKLY